MSFRKRFVLSACGAAILSLVLYCNLTDPVERNPTAPPAKAGALKAAQVNQLADVFSLDSVHGERGYTGSYCPSGTVHTTAFQLRDFEQEFYTYCGGQQGRYCFPEAYIGMRITSLHEDDTVPRYDNITVKHAIYVFPTPGSGVATRIDTGGTDIALRYGTWTDLTLGASVPVDTLSKVMRQTAGATLNGYWNLTVTSGTQKVTRRLNFTAEKPNFNGLYLLDAEDSWKPVDWSNPSLASKPLYIIIHGWQSTAYPDFLWLLKMGQTIRGTQGDVNVAAWFWQAAATSSTPVLPWFHISSQAVRLAQALRTSRIFQKGLPEIHFIGHSYGGAVAAEAEFFLKAQVSTTDNCCLVLLDVPGRRYAGIKPVELRGELRSLQRANLQVKNFYCPSAQGFGVPYQNINVVNDPVCTDCDHKAPIFYFVDQVQSGLVQFDCPVIPGTQAANQ
jgi:pimeloyl-ACP methyl ester carboxylesterase